MNEIMKGIHSDTSIVERTVLVSGEIISFGLVLRDPPLAAPVGGDHRTI